MTAYISASPFPIGSWASPDFKSIEQLLIDFALCVSIDLVLSPTLMKKGFSPLIITFFISPDISTPAITLEDISRKKYRAIYLMTCNVKLTGRGTES
jgi:hypothetical protein